MTFSLISLPFRIIYLTHAWFFTFDVLLLSRRRARTPMAVCTLIIFLGILIHLYGKCAPSQMQELPIQYSKEALSQPCPPVQCSDNSCSENRELFEAQVKLLTGRLESLESKLQMCHCSPPPATVMRSEFEYSNLQVQQICQQIMKIYDADKTGLADYAQESGGGTVISTRCSETYENNMGRYYLFNFIPLLWKRPTPRIAIQPIRDVGECWPFRGTVGYLVLQLSRRIHIKSVTLEHIPASIALEGNIKSAPRDFQVYGLSSAEDTVGQLLGNFTYDILADPWQNFPIDLHSNETFDHVELKILSNHGNIHYTCLYRFRVHGKPVNEDDSTY